MFKKIKDNFLTKEFITFFIIGAVTTIVHLIFYNLGLIIDVAVLPSMIIAFILASIFNYFVNLKFTFTKKGNHKTMFLASLMFLFKLFLNMLFTLVFEYLIKIIGYEPLIKLLPIFVAASILPIQYLLFSKIMKGVGDD